MRFIYILLFLKGLGSVAQDYSDCIIVKSRLISSELLESKVNRTIKDLKNQDLVVLNENLIKDKKLVRSPYVDNAFGSIEYLIGRELNFIRRDGSEMLFKDVSGQEHLVYFAGDFRGSTIATNVEIAIEKNGVAIDSGLVGRTVVLNDRSIHSLFETVSKHVVHMIKYNPERDKFYLLLKEIYPDGSRQDGFTGYDIGDERFGILDYECFIQNFTEHKNRYLDYLSTNFTSREIESIKKGSIFIGMSEEAVPHVLGYPSETNTTVTALGTSKQLIYGDGIYVYILDGKVNAYQNLESLKGY